MTVIILSHLSSFAFDHPKTGTAIEKENDWLVSPQILNPETNTVNRSVILIHGFVGSPFDLKPLAKPLCDKGFRVVIPVVPEQTKETPILKRGKYTPDNYIKWLSKIVNTETKLLNKKPYLVGFSMGEHYLLLLLQMA